MGSVWTGRFNWLYRVLRLLLSKTYGDKISNISSESHALSMWFHDMGELEFLSTLKSRSSAHWQHFDGLSMVCFHVIISYVNISSKAGILKVEE